jgi:hypothetical protein
MPDMVISALVQAPFVLAMAYLVQRFLAHLSQRDEEWQGFTERTYSVMAERIDGLTEAIERLTDLLITHDALTRGIGPETRREADEALRLVGRGK